MLIRKIYVLCGMCLICLLSACEIYNPEEQVPAYLQIESFTMVSNPDANAGSLSHDIRDAWVFVDDEMIGVFELPAKIPVLASGSHKLSIGPGIFVSTLSDLRINYLYYDDFENLAYDFVPGQTQNLTPQVMYRDAGSTYEYIVVDDFENAFTVMDTFSKSQVAMELTQDPDFVFEGRGSGMIEISASNSEVYFKTPAYPFPAQGNEVFMEINYYSDFAVNIGLFIRNDGVRDQVLDYITVKQTTDEEKKWKKAYIALDDLISQASNPIDYFVYFDVLIHEAASRKDGKVVIDNVKFLYAK